MRKIVFFTAFLVFLVSQAFSQDAASSRTNSNAERIPTVQTNSNVGGASSLQNTVHGNDANSENRPIWKANTPAENEATSESQPERQSAKKSDAPAQNDSKTNATSPNGANTRTTSPANANGMAASSNDANTKSTATPKDAAKENPDANGTAESKTTEPEKSAAKTTARTTRQKSADYSDVQDGQKPIYTPEQQRLRVTAADIRLVPEKDFPTKGFHLYVRKRPGIESVLLTETTKDPTGRSDNYAYRAKEYNPINGDEIRFLDGKVLDSEWAKYSLVDSTPEPYAAFGEAFHIYIPSTIVYGYEWTRNGEIEIGKGTFINIRTFEKKFADYSGNFMDNPFMFDLQTKTMTKVVKKKVEPPPEPELEPEPQVEEEETEPEPLVEEETELKPLVEEVVEEEAEPEPEPVTILIDDYNPVASDKFKEIAERMMYSKGPETIISDILSFLDDVTGPTDIVFAIDATGSMKDDIDKLKTELVPALLTQFRTIPNVRLGLLFYRDYGDNFNYNNLPVRFYEFTSNFNSFNKNLNALTIKGTEGGDIPEPVYEALYASVKFYRWSPGSKRKVILIGDAEPHPHPRNSGKYSREYVTKIAKDYGVKIDAILLPNK